MQNTENTLCKLKHRDEIFMQRCLDLAWNGLGKTAPNPMVGCVITLDDKIIGEGYHKAFGKPHAEIEAIRSVKDKSLLGRSTLYVNLEPCNHQGKTPPCTEAIIESGIPRVVIGATDRNEHVKGGGIERLREAGCTVLPGLLSQKAIDLNKRFYTFHQLKRPYVILKWAQTTNGFIDRKRSGGKPLRISGKQALILSHKWRSEEQAILVGKNTALLDNPRLNVRNWAGDSPLRITLDKNLSLPQKLHLLDGSYKTWVFTEKTCKDRENLSFIKISFDAQLLHHILCTLYAGNMQSLLVEGGATLLHAFIKQGLWDEARIFVSPKTIAEGVKAPDMPAGYCSLRKTGTDSLYIICKQ